MQNPSNKRMKTKPSHKIGLCTLLLLFCILLIFPSTSLPQQDQESPKTTIKSKVNSKIKLSIGYDDNVSDRIKDPIKSRFLQLYINSDIKAYPTPKSFFSMKIQDGLKYHDARSLANESILINRINFCLSHKLSNRFTPELCGEVRGRTSIHSESNITSSEESYLRGYAGLALGTMIFSDLYMKPFYNFKATNFEDFDPYDRKGHEFGCGCNIKLLPNAFIRFQYSRELMNFDKWEDNRAKRKDSANVMTAGIQLYKNILVNINASYESNSSDVDGYSYKGYMLSGMMAKAISDNTVIELYTLFRSRTYDSPPDNSDSPQIDIEDEERNAIIAKISRDITKRVALEIQYDLRRNRSGLEGETYLKNVISASIVSDF